MVFLYDNGGDQTHHFAEVRISHTVNLTNFFNIDLNNYFYNGILTPYWTTGCSIPAHWSSFYSTFANSCGGGYGLTVFHMSLNV